MRQFILVCLGVACLVACNMKEKKQATTVDLRQENQLLKKQLAAAEELHQKDVEDIDEVRRSMRSVDLVVKQMQAEHQAELAAVKAAVGYQPPSPWPQQSAAQFARGLVSGALHLPSYGGGAHPQSHRDGFNSRLHGGRFYSAPRDWAVLDAAIEAEREAYFNGPVSAVDRVSNDPLLYPQQQCYYGGGYGEGSSGFLDMLLKMMPMMMPPVR